METQFESRIQKAQKLTKRLNKLEGLIQKAVDEEDILKAQKTAIDYIVNAERFCMNARLLPIDMGGSLDVEEELTSTVIKEMDIKVGYTDKGWFQLKIPSILPKKRKGSASYIRASAYMALNDFFNKHPREKYQEKVVMVFQHYYSIDRPDRKYRDHDNIETNVIADAIAVYVLYDDGPLYCDHHYLSKIGDKDETIVTLIPTKDFPKWLEGEIQNDSI